VPRIPASQRDAFYESRRSELAGVALKLWAEHGFDQTSVEAIAREAGISKGTFYLYFESKDALLLDVLRRNSLVPNILALIDDLQNKSLEQALTDFVRGAWQHLLAHRELVLVVVRELPTHLERAREILAQVIVPANVAVARYLESRIAPERAREISSVIAVRALIGMILATFLTQEILGAGRLVPVPEDRLVATIVEVFLRGVGSGPAGAATP
jgi:AcrR family transcriptional regulator